MANDLDKELKFFDAHKKEWLTHYKDQFALVKGEGFFGTFTTFEEAFNAGVDRFGNQPFLVKKIVENEPKMQFPALAVGLISVRS
jgi:hypothetical protein